MNEHAISRWSSLQDRIPAYALAANVEFVVIRFDESVSVFYGRCLHRCALLFYAHIDDDNLMYGLHNWGYRYDTDISEYNHSNLLRKFAAWRDGDNVLVDLDEIAGWEQLNPQASDRAGYQGLYQDSHGSMDTMGVPYIDLRGRNDIPLNVTQLHKPPLLDDHCVATDVTIGGDARQSLELAIPLFFSDMSDLSSITYGGVSGR